MPYFSVVIPLYNKAHFVLRTVESALSQDFSDFEIIVIDDGSTDGSADVLRDVADSRLIVVNQENAGVAAARNRGIELSRGRYLAFLDADDVWRPYYLTEIRKIIESYPEAGMYVTAYDVVLPKGKIVHSSEDVGSTGVKRSYWSTLKSAYDFVWTSATVIPKRLVDEVGGFLSGELIGQDLDLWARVAQVNPLIGYSTKRCVEYNRCAENNARARVKIAYARAFMQTLECEAANEARDPEEIEAIESKYRKKMVAYVYTTILNGDCRKARELLDGWSLGRNEALVAVLKFASILPTAIHRAVYAVRLRVF